MPAVIALAAGAVGLAWVAIQGPALVLVAVITLCFCVASLTHAAITRGATCAGALAAVAPAVSWCAEVAGLTTGLPFGTYHYSDRLGLTLSGVPILVPVAWTMIAYPSLVVSSRITTHRWRGPLTTGLAMAAWDLLLDPVMVRDGFWTWSAAAISWADVPLLNALGWTATGSLIGVLVWPAFATARQAGGPDDRVPLSLYAGSALLLAVKAAMNGMVDVSVVGLLGVTPFVMAAAGSRWAPVDRRHAAWLGTCLVLSAATGLAFWSFE